MRLYHGTNVVISKVDLSNSRNQLDFGAGYYLTDDISHARKVENRRAKLFGGTPIINEYDWNAFQSTLSILEFEDSSEDWLDYVDVNRGGEGREDYDIVIGPIADDDALPVLTLYQEGNLDKSATILALKAQVFPFQWVFKTEESLKELIFVGDSR